MCACKVRSASRPLSDPLLLVACAQSIYDRAMQDPVRIISDLFGGG
jgi:hypothetical protein